MYIDGKYVSTMLSGIVFFFSFKKNPPQRVLNELLLRGGAREGREIIPP